MNMMMMGVQTCPPFLPRPCSLIRLETGHKYTIENQDTVQGAETEILKVSRLAGMGRDSEYPLSSRLGDRTVK